MTDLEQVRTIVKGYKAAHTLEQERLDGLADATLGTLAKRDLRVLAFKEAKVAAEFGTVADLLDTLADAMTTQIRVVTDLVDRLADGGAWVYDEAEA